jgi:hypothetical protein
MSPTLEERGIHLLDPKDDFLRVEPYLPDFAESALVEGEDTALLAAICLRETWAGWAPGYTPKGSYLGRGDGGHGWGLLQIDDRGPYAHLPKECPEATPMLQARWACSVLRDARKYLAEFKPHPLWERGCVAAYNAGAPKIAKVLARWHPGMPLEGHPELDPDLCTTGKNYGADVLRRRDLLRAVHRDRFPPFQPRPA